MRLIDAYEQFLLEYRKESTRRSYRYILLALINHIGRGWDVSDVAKVHILRYVEELEAGNVRNVRGDAPVKIGTPESLYKHIKAIKRFFNYLVDEGILDSSPATRIKNPRPSRRIAPDKALTDAELNAMLAVSQGQTRRLIRQRAILLMLFTTGARADGISNLTLDDVDWDRRRVIIYERKREKEVIAYPTPAAFAALGEWLAIRPHTDLPFVFCTVNGDPAKMTSDAIRSLIQRVRKRAGINRPIGTHRFRHRFGEDLARNGVSPSIAAMLMGHDDPKTTIDHYYNYNEREAEAAARQLHERRDGKRASAEIRRKLSAK